MSFFLSDRCFLGEECMSVRVGYIGLGIMGLAMTGNLLKAGFPVHVWNRTSAKMREAEEAGGVPVDDPASMRSVTDVVLVCVTDERALREVLIESPRAFLKGRGGAGVVVDMSTVSPSTEGEVSEILGKEGITYIDAPVTGGDVGARNGTLTIMAGGEESAFHRVLPVFQAIGRNIAHTGPIGTGQLTKCVNQILVALNVAAVTEAIAFLQRSGLDVQKTFDLLASGAAGSWALSNYGPRVLRGDLKPGFRAVDMLKDIKIVLAEADRMKLQLPGVELMRELYEALCAIQEESLGNHGLISLYK